MRRYFIVGSRIDELLRLACLPFLPTKLARLRCVLVAHCVELIRYGQILPTATASVGLIASGQWVSLITAKRYVPQAGSPSGVRLATSGFRTKRFRPALKTDPSDSHSSCQGAGRDHGFG